LSSTPVEISVVICAYTEDRWDDLVAAIESVRRQTAPAHEIVVVADHNPTLLQRVRTAAGDVIAVPNEGERGLSGARNSGIAASTGDVVAFMDDDAYADPDWITHLSSAYEDPAVIAAGGTIEAVWLAGRPDWFPPEFDWVVGCTYHGLPSRRAAVRNLIGCNMSFRREVFEAVGGFRSGIGRVGTTPVGGEETELSIRASQARPAGIILHEPLARVFHRVPAARGLWSYFVARCRAEGYSKALIARFVGSPAGLASERRYTLRVLPSAVLQSVGDSFRQRDSAGLRRAAAIVAGLSVTTFGYARAAITFRMSRATFPASRGLTPLPPAPTTPGVGTDPQGRGS
jgi:glycosyltransferase involved in cell wall biosynthesis